MEPDHRDALRIQTVYLGEHLSVTNDLIDHMRQSGVFTEEDCDELAYRRLRRDQVRYIAMILPRKGPTAMFHFIKSLIRTQQWHVAIRLDGDLARAIYQDMGERAVDVAAQRPFFTRSPPIERPPRRIEVVAAPPTPPNERMSEQLRRQWPTNTVDICMLTHYFTCNVPFRGKSEEFDGGLHTTAEKHIWPVELALEGLLLNGDCTRVSKDWAAVSMSGANYDALGVHWHDSSSAAAAALKRETLLVMSSAAEAKPQKKFPHPSRFDKHIVSWAALDQTGETVYEVESYRPNPRGFVARTRTQTTAEDPTELIGKYL